MSLPRTVPLFRPEAVSHRLGTAFGDVVLPRSRSLGLFAYIAILSTMGVCLVIGLGSYTTIVPAAGWLEYSPAQAKAIAHQDGTVTRVWHRTGEHVVTGDPLIEITMSRSSAELREIPGVVLNKLKAQRDTLVSQIEAERLIGRDELPALTNSLEATERNVRRLNEMAEVAEQRVEIAKRTHERAVAAVARGALPAQAGDETEEAYLAARTAFLNAQREATEMQDRAVSLQTQKRVKPLQSKRLVGELERQLADIDQRIADAGAASSEVLVAPIDGVVSSSNGQVGQHVGAGETLVSVTPSGATLRATLLVPTRVSGFVETARKVTLRYDAFPYQKYGSVSGTVVSIDRLALTPGERRFPVEFREPVHMVTVVLDQQEIQNGSAKVALQPGMTLRGDISQETKRLGHWLVDPLFNVIHR